MSATKGYGTILAYGDAATYSASVTWTSVTVVESIDPPNIEADDINTTHLLSAGEFKEFIAGLADGGEIKMTVQWDETQSTALYGLFRTQKGWRISFPNSSGKVGVDGYIKAFGFPTVDDDNIIKNEITIKVTGVAVVAAVP